MPNKSIFSLVTWISIGILLTAEGCYVRLVDPYEYELSLGQILFSTAILLLWCFLLTRLPQKKLWLPFKLLGATVLVFTILFALFEFMIIEFSGYGFVAETFRHIEFESIRIALFMHPVLFLVSGVVCLLLIIYLLGSHISAVPPKAAIVVLVVASPLMYFFLKGSALGRFVENYRDFSRTPVFASLDAESLNELARFGIRPSALSKEDIVARLPKSPRNVVILYLESFSEFFVNHPDYPGLTPELDRLSERYTNLNNYYSTASATIEGFVSSFCGFLPYMDFGNDSFNPPKQPYRNLPCFSDVLRMAGYHQEFIGGANKNFSNKRAFLESHGIDRVWGRSDFTDSSQYPQNTWGIQDDKLYEFSMKRIQRLHEGNKPFHVSILNLGTHLKGFPSPSCPQYALNPQEKYLNGIHCTDFLLGQFIDGIKDRGFLEDTTVFITADHGVFDSRYISELFPHHGNVNKIFGLVIDDNYDINSSVVAGLYDLAPTVLDSLGIDSNVAFINGVSMRSIPDERVLLSKKFVVAQNQLYYPKNKCMDSDPMEPPLDRCEHQSILNLLWGHAATFSETANEDVINLTLPDSSIQITSSVKEESPVRIVLNGEDQVPMFYDTGDLITEKKRGKHAYLYLLVLDAESHQVLLRRGIRYRLGKAKFLRKIREKVSSYDRSYVLIFVHSGKQKKPMSVAMWEVLQGIGLTSMRRSIEPYVAVFVNKKGETALREWVDEDHDGVVEVLLEGRPGLGGPLSLDIP